MRSKCFFIVLAVALASTACRTTKQPVIVHTPADTHSEIRDDRSNVYVHDTVFRERFRNVYVGDTVIIHDSIYEYRGYIYLAGDTVYITTTDTIHPEPITVEVPVEVERKRSGFENFLYWSGGILWMIVLVIIFLTLAIWLMRATMK